MPDDPPAIDPGPQLTTELSAVAGGHGSDIPNLTACDAEPITRLERIQSFGFLIATTRDWVVVRVSANLESMLGIAPAAALGVTLDSLVDAEALHDIRNSMAGLSTSGSVERLYDVSLIPKRIPLDLAIHYAEGLWVLEGEPAGLDSRTDAASLVRKMVIRLNSQTSLDAFHQDAARQVRSLTGFDRAMIYRFQRDGAGVVIAEVVKPGKEQLLGLHYPATDIPIQARVLYLRNPFRIIADVGAPTVPLQSREASASESLDLSLATTRAVSEVHIEYLRNMGVAASLSISIVVNGKLWGLIACHHDAPKLPTFVTRTAAELFGQMYSMTLESRLRVIEDHEENHANQAVGKMIMSVAANAELLTDSGWLQDVIREVIPCDGVAIIVNGAVAACGATPAAADVEAIAKYLTANASDEVFASDRLSELRPPFPTLTEHVAGALCIPISLGAGDFVMVFRREQLRNIRWAGAPEEAKAFQVGGRISPRKSFETFSESVRGRSRPFSDAEQRIAGQIRAGFI